MQGEGRCSENEGRLVDLFTRGGLSDGIALVGMRSSRRLVSGHAGAEDNVPVRCVSMAA